PEFDLDNGRLLGVEALVRWDHPERGPVPAMEIIELAEKSDLIGELGSWALRQACSQAAAWDRGSAQDRFKIWINLSQGQLSEPGLVQEIVATMADAGVKASSIGVEITETVLLADPVAAGKCIQALRSLGLEVALDDFGTGYSSLSFLRRFPIDVVKIDGSFVAGLGQNQQDAAIVYSVVSMGHSLGLAVVAEGVETETQRLELEMLGCDRVQGWLYSPALPPDEIEAWMNRYEEAWAHNNNKPRQVRSYSALRPSGPEPTPRGRLFPWIGATPTLGVASIMRVTAWLFGACGALALISPQLPLDHVSALGMESVGLMTVAVGLVVRFLPWRRWPRAVTLVLVPVAFALIAAYNYFGGGDAYRYAVFFMLLYAWIGMALPRWASAATLPILAAAYLIPLEAGQRGSGAAWSFVYVALICILISEVVAWSLYQFGTSQVALGQEQRWSQSLVRYSNDLICALEDEGHVIFASFASERLVGQRPSDLIGTNLFDLIHPDDQATAHDAMDYVRERQGQPLAFDVRLRHRDKSWRWCALTAQNLLDRPGVGAILINASD
ncbi:MAG: EAL domain-containing protein, partial [Acidimicrobiales bacterium]